MTLKIEDLDEFEGLTADMVRAWLRANSWELAGTVAHQYWRCGSDEVAESLLLTDLPWCIGYIANGHGLSAQSLLCEINPRMRAGWPSEEERAKHRYWIATWVMGYWDETTQEDVGSIDSLHIGCFDEDDEDGTPVFVAGDDLWTEEDVRRLDMKFWPCDQHGNKTRRGA